MAGSAPTVSAPSAPQAPCPRPRGLTGVAGLALCLRVGPRGRFSVCNGASPLYRLGSPFMLRNPGRCWLSLKPQHLPAWRGLYRKPLSGSPAQLGQQWWFSSLCNRSQQPFQGGSRHCLFLETLALGLTPTGTVGAIRIH